MRAAESRLGELRPEVLANFVCRTPLLLIPCLFLFLLSAVVFLRQMLALVAPTYEAEAVMALANRIR